MSAVASLAVFMKKHVLGQSLIRRNPFYYEKSRALLDNAESLDLAQRRAWSEAQVRNTLQWASITDYGRSVHAGDALASWPLLEKENLRHGLGAFTTGNEWLSAPATTGGTSGVPLKVLRSLEAIVFEQAAIDQVIRSAGGGARAARPAGVGGGNTRGNVGGPASEGEGTGGG